jgi:hypothetical protein
VSIPDTTASPTMKQLSFVILAYENKKRSYPTGKSFSRNGKHCSLEPDLNVN